MLKKYHKDCFVTLAMTVSRICAVISNLRHEGEKSVEKVEISPRSSSK
jgi:hypothetical protein